MFRTYHSFHDTAEEIGMSRIYGGIHFLSSDLDGLKLGSEIGDYVVGRFFRPVPEPRAAAILGIAAALIGFRVISRRLLLFPGRLSRSGRLLLFLRRA